MKGILVFDLEDPSDSEKFRVAARATDWYLVCLELDRELRNTLKYHQGSKEVETIRTKLRELMDYYGVSLEDMS